MFKKQTDQVSGDGIMNRFVPGMAITIPFRYSKRTSGMERVKS
jgi:hypothetical protein